MRRTSLMALFMAACDRVKPVAGLVPRHLLLSSNRVLTLEVLRAVPHQPGRCHLVNPCWKRRQAPNLLSLTAPSWTFLPPRPS
jgi:hypothetical protein